MLAAALAGIAAWTHAATGDAAATTAAAWPPLHLLLAATGSLASPLLPLAAAWVVVLGRQAPGLALPAAAVAAILVPALDWLDGAPPPIGPQFSYELLIALATALVAFRSGRTSAAAPGKGAEARKPPARRAGEETDAEVLAAALELARRATDAHEAGLWRREGETARLVGRVAVPGLADPEPELPLEGNPFAWAIEERLPQHVQRGRRALPSAWAAEMLLVPVELPEGVLALAYPGVVPPGAEATALAAGAHVSTVMALLRTRGDERRERERVEALADAVRTLPGELELDRFAAQLAEAVRRGTGAAGAAVALGLDEGGRGKVLHVSSVERQEAKFADSFGEDESRLALALKHAVDFAWDDLRRERERLPLLTAGEKWDAPPRSAAVFPLVADGRALGAVVAWHPEAGRFGEKEIELLRQLGSVAPLPLRSGIRFGEMDHKAHTDSLTGLPNRATFEQRLQASASYFDRYARPFSVLVLDIDFFKKFNDTWGHEVGDRVLKHVADLLRLGVRDVDLPARLGGEEFVVILPETGLRQSAEVAERIRRSIEARPLVHDGRPLSVTVSIGAAACPDCTVTPAEVLKLADEALYRAKGAGRNRVSTAPRTGKPEVGA